MPPSTDPLLAQLQAVLQGGSTAPRTGYERQMAQQALEMLQRGTPLADLYQELRLAGAKAQINLDVSAQPNAIALHSHTFYEVLFILGGDVDYLLNGQRYQLQRGDVVLVPPGVSHRPLFLRPMGQPYQRYALWLDAAYYAEQCAQYPELDLAFQQCRRRGSFLLRSTPATWAGLESAFSMLYKEALEQRPAWQLCVASGALSLMAHISRTYYYQDSASPAAESDTLLDHMFRYIDTHLTEKITLEGMARHCMVSKSTVSHLFQQKLGVSFYHCVVQRRLIAAKNSMLAGQPLRLVWEDCGFADYSSFYRLFKKEYALSPREFLALHKQRAG